MLQLRSIERIAVTIIMYVVMLIIFHKYPALIFLQFRYSTGTSRQANQRRIATVALIFALAHEK
jgi:hypothetical protein